MLTVLGRLNPTKLFEGRVWEVAMVMVDVVWCCLDVGGVMSMLNRACAVFAISWKMASGLELV